MIRDRQDPGEKQMSSGAYTLSVDQPAGAEPDAPMQRVIPLVPVANQGAIPFNSGWLSLAYDDFEPYYTRAEHLYCVHGERRLDPHDPPASAPVWLAMISRSRRVAF